MRAKVSELFYQWLVLIPEISKKFPYSCCFSTHRKEMSGHVVLNALGDGFLVQLSQCPCPGGYSCEDGLCYPCRLGEYCAPGSSNPMKNLLTLQCPLGQVCLLPNYSIPCPPGAICPLGSYLPTFCADIIQGAYCPSQSTNLTPCAPGYYCPNPAVQLACPKGFFCKGIVVVIFFGIVIFNFFFFFL
jgi:hypothetical protein